MFKIKLSILLLTSCFLLLSCTKDRINQINKKYSLSYIGGGNDGLILKNNLISHLKASNLYDQSSKLIINAKINHNSNIYITNIDNTSDRERITTFFSANILDQKNECIIFQYQKNISQFYIFAPNEKFLSNKKAIKEIKQSNTEILIKEFINRLNFSNDECTK